MASNRTLANCLFALILTLLLMAGAYNLRLQQGLTDEERRLTLHVQQTMNRLLGPGHASTWLTVENGRLQALVTVDHTEPEKYRGALESLLNVDVARGDRLDLLTAPVRADFAHEWRKARLLGLVTILLALGYLAGLRRWEPSPVPACVAWPARIAGGVLCLGLPLWLLLVPPGALIFTGVVLALLGRPWRFPRVPVPTVLKFATVALLAGLAYAAHEGPESRISRQVRESLGAPAWVLSVRRGDQWGSLAAVRVNPADTAPALRLAQLETTVRQSLPNVRVAVLGVEQVPVRGPWRLIVLNLLAIAGLVYALKRPRPEAPTAAPEPREPEPVKQPEPPKRAESVVSLMQVDPLSLEVGRGLLPLVDPNRGAPLLGRVTAIRRHLALELGLVTPGLRFRDNLSLKHNEYRILLRTVEIARGQLEVGRLLTVGPTEKVAKLGEVVSDPTYGMPAVWIDSDRRGDAEGLGCLLFDEISVVAVQLTEQIRLRAPQLLGLQETKALVDTWRKTHPAVIQAVEARVDLVLIWEVLRGLLAEQVSIRDLESIFNAIIRSDERTPEALVEVCRDELAAHICQSLARPDGGLVAAELPEEVERLLRRSPDGLLEPDDAVHALELIEAEVARFEGLQPILLTPPGLRLSLRRLTERSLPQVVCLSYSQVAPGVIVKTPAD